MILKRPIRSIRQAVKYLIPRRLTMQGSPKICAWLWWNY